VTGNWHEGMEAPPREFHRAFKFIIIRPLFAAQVEFGFGFGSGIRSVRCALFYYFPE